MTNVYNLFHISILQGLLLLSSYIVLYGLIIGGDYETGYLMRFLFPGVVMFAIGATMIYRYDMVKDMVFGLVLFTTLTMLYVQFLGADGSYGFSSMDRLLLGEETGIGAIAQGRLAGSLALVCMLMALINRGGWSTAIMLALSSVAVIWMATVGTRGALVSLLSALFLYVMVSSSKTRSVRRVAICAFFLVPVLVSSGITDTLLAERTKELFEPGQLESMKRVERMYVFADSVSDNLVIGLGPGGWAKYLWGDMSARTYPHNILMEVQLEYGIIGSLLLLWIVFSGVRITIKMCSQRGTAPEFKILSVLWVYYFVSALFSGSLIQGNELLFAFTGVLGAMYFWHIVDKRKRNVRWVTPDTQVRGMLVGRRGKRVL